MLLQIIGLLIANLIVPVYLLYVLWREDHISKFRWLISLLYTGLFLVFIFIIGRWEWVGYYSRYLLIAAFLLIGFVTYRRVRPQPFYYYEGSRRWQKNLGKIIEMLIGAGIMVFIFSGFFYSGEPVRLDFPLENGNYYIGHGGNNFLLNYHNTVESQKFALDILELNTYGFRARGLYPKQLDQYVIFGETVYSPCDGRVRSAVDGLPDHIPPERDRENVAGNHVEIACQGTVVVLAHLKNGSVLVSEGDAVTASQPLGQVGNSGNTTEPHLHIHAVAGEGADPLEGQGIPITFDGVFPIRNMLFNE